MRSKGSDPRAAMKVIIRRLGALVDKAFEAIIRLHDGIMPFICLFWLLPLIAAVVISVLVYDLRPLLRDKLETILLYGLVALPPWLALCLCAEQVNSATARRLKAWMARMPVYVGYVVLGVGGVLWLFGAI
jgi:hypothetical protein